MIPKLYTSFLFINRLIALKHLVKCMKQSESANKQMSIVL